MTNLVAVGLDKRLDVSKLLVAQGKFGDMAGAITGIIMHGSAFFGMQAEPNTPNTCLLYTSPSPRD